MPKHPHLTRIGDMWYFRAKVPLGLIDAYGGKTEVKRSLRTRDPQEALRLVRIASGEFEKDNEAKRAVQAGVVSSVDDGRLIELAIDWLEEQLRRNAAADLRPDASWSEEEAADQLQTMYGDEDIALGEIARNDLSGTYNVADRLLARHGLALDRLGPQYRALCQLLLRASLESSRRSIAALKGDFRVLAFDELFKDVRAPYSAAASRYFVPNAVSPAPRPNQTAKPECRTLGDVITSYLNRPASKGLSRKSQDKETATFDLLGSILGRDRPITSITADDCTAAHDIISKLPPNYTKRFGNILPAEMAKRAETEGLAPLKAQTQRSYLTRLKTLFKYAKMARYIDYNPAEIISLPKDTVRANKKRRPFSMDQLQVIFTSPLYTGCIDDDRGAFKPGPNVVRRGRFWVPLLALWTGMRLNECCQLTVDDITNHGDIWVISVRPDPETGKSVKNGDSDRLVPVHPELVRLGFIAFVQRQQQSNAGRLFPELPRDVVGYLSGPFSKRYATYLDTLGIRDPKLTFHSFRHNFADALRRADISSERQDALGGWTGAGSLRKIYGDGLGAELYGDMCKVSYPGLDLSHLHVQETQAHNTNN